MANMRELKKILGDSFGGPSIGFEAGEYILYTWGPETIEPGNADLLPGLKIESMVTHVMEKNWNTFVSECIAWDERGRKSFGHIFERREETTWKDIELP